MKTIYRWTWYIPKTESMVEAETSNCAQQEHELNFAQQEHTISLAQQQEHKLKLCSNAEQGPARRGDKL